MPISPNDFLGHPEGFLRLNPHLFGDRSGSALRRTGGVSTATPAERENDLRDDIIDYCRAHGWICFCGSTAAPTRRTLGEPDAVILADHGRVFFVELKSKTGKLRPSQQAIIAWAAKLQHPIHVIRSLAEFKQIVFAPETKPNPSPP